jgi:hypothetical protein
MVTRNSTDSSNSVLASNDERLPLDVKTDEGPGVCPASLPNCGPVPGVSGSSQPSPERAVPTGS